MNIAICDDEKYFIDQITSYCMKYKQINNIDLNLFHFLKGEDILLNNTQIDLLFLDIGLPGLSGIEVKNIIEKRDNISFIVFVTSYSNYIYDAFGKKTLGFLNKPYNYQNISNMILKCINILEEDVVIDVPISNNTIPIKASIIKYIKAENYYSEIITDNKNYLVRKYLNDWEKLLIDYSFIRIHKSYLVNMAFIKEVNGAYIELVDGEMIKISRTKINQIRIEIYDYRKKHAY
ncbi:MAG TPA: LytTR family DNA-binding domain-containing protein [Mobilitalea sp.]|nr:LytTR family DNA-binding domain-containing protein [Mobilitalea sp.]